MADLVVTGFVADGVATLDLNRPEARNPTSIAMLDAIDAGLDRIEARDDVRVLLLGGAGRAFCSGLDLAEARADETTIRRMLQRLSEVMRRLRRLPIATIARVQGAAIGGGFGLMVVCDLTVSHAEVKLGYPPLATGLSPALMAPWLIRRIGPSRARALLVRGGTITGRQAHDMGIVSHLAPRDDLGRTARRLAGELAQGGPHAMAAMKTLLNDLDGSLDDAMLDRAATVSADVIASAETQARLDAMFGARGG